jgi:putative nucleotidyltransferase with HDIG domain
MAGIAAARFVYDAAVQTAEALWDAARAGDHPDPASADRLAAGLAGVIVHDRASLLALAALKNDDTEGRYTFTHMVNVAALTMIQAAALNIDGPLLRAFGVAALLHDIGKVNTPPEILHKPEKLTREEFEIMKRHVLDGASILRRTPGISPLAPVVALEHHLKQDLSGYPENLGHRTLNLCTLVVSIADVFDALRSNRPYRQGLATSRIQAIMGQRDNPAFNQPLLKQFVEILGLFPVGTLVQLRSRELAVVTAEQPGDPLRPQVRIIVDADGTWLEAPLVANTWEHDSHEPLGRTVVQAVDPDAVGIDPLSYL